MSFSVDAIPSAFCADCLCMTVDLTHDQARALVRASRRGRRLVILIGAQCASCGRSRLTVQADGYADSPGRALRSHLHSDERLMGRQPKSRRKGLESMGRIRGSLYLETEPRHRHTAPPTTRARAVGFDVVRECEKKERHWRVMRGKQHAGQLQCFGAGLEIPRGFSARACSSSRWRSARSAGPGRLLLAVRTPTALAALPQLGLANLGVSTQCRVYWQHNASVKRLWRPEGRQSAGLERIL